MINNTSHQLQLIPINLGSFITFQSAPVKRTLLLLLMIYPWFLKSQSNVSEPIYVNIQKCSGLVIDNFKPKSYNKNAYALVVGISDYTTRTKLPYSKNDADNVKNYFQHYLGIPESNITKTAHNLPSTLFKDELQKFYNKLKNSTESKEIYFYFSGHGVTLTADRGQELVFPDAPTEIKSDDGNGCIKVSDVFKILGSNPGNSVFCIIDACSQTKGNPITHLNLQDNQLLFKSTDEVSFPLDEECSSFFTFHFLNELRNSNSTIYIEWFDKVKEHATQAKYNQGVGGNLLSKKLPKPQN